MDRYNLFNNQEMSNETVLIYDKKNCFNHFIDFTFISFEFIFIIFKGRLHLSVSQGSCL